MAGSSSSSARALSVEGGKVSALHGVLTRGREGLLFACSCLVPEVEGSESLDDDRQSLSEAMRRR
jgi:hypothetical protein